MRRFFSLVSVATALLFCQTLKAQMVTIPDPNFLIFLQNSDVAGCLTGNQLDASCSAVVNKTTLDCHNFNISNLTGIQAFVNLHVLDCNTNQLAALPALPAALTILNCTYNQLTALPGLPATLTHLYCSHNQLAALPGLPALSYLNCANNQIPVLPGLPAALTDLICSGNQLTALPNLPATLTNLDCHQNLLASLPNIPTSLTYLTCSQNLLAALPNLPAALTNLVCEDNQISVMPGLPATLTYLDCRLNQLAALPSLPAVLTELICEHNQLTALPNLPAALIHLACYNNQISVLPDLPAALTDLDCADNQLTALPNLPAALTHLYCANNQLTGLPPLPGVMASLNVANNPGIACLPPIQKLTGDPLYSTISGTGIACLPNIIQHTGSIPSIDNLPLCGIFGNGCEVAWNIEGNVYRDDNTNCAVNNNEPNLQNVKLQLLQGGTVQQQVFSNGAGNYSFDTNSGTYQTRVDTSGLPFYVTCPSDNSHTSNLVAADSLDYNSNFALQCKPGYDLAVQSVVHASGLFFPAHFARVAIQAGDLALYYGLTCNTAGMSGTVTVTYSGPVSISSVSGNGLVVGNTVTWNVSDFSQLDFFHDFLITFLTDTIPASNQLCMTVDLNAAAGTDNNPGNNSLTQCFNVVNSFDPNVKEVYPQNWHEPGDWHTYTVRFQNTGTAAAQHIQVIDTLDSNLDWSSFQLLAYSHDNLTQVLQNGIVRFNFPNINLPDSSYDESNSHGWIQYRIKTKSDIQPGTTIHNTASIYFDFNTPVITNDALVTYCFPVETQQSFSVCEGDSIQVGSNWYHQAGTYTNAFTNTTGCDSVVTTTVDIETVDAAVTQQTISLTAAPGMASYQWFNCDNGQPMQNANEQTFTATQNGSYAVQLVSTNGCPAQSSCYAVTGSSVASINAVNILLYPNPTQNAVIVNHPALSNAVLVLTDMIGRTLQTQRASNSQTTLTLNDIAPGSYCVRFTVDDKTVATQKLIVIR